MAPMDGSVNDLGRVNMTTEIHIEKETLFGIEVSITYEERVNYEAMCSNWNLLVKFAEDFNEQDFIKSMVVERKNRNREYILKRLYQKFSTLRREREHKVLGIVQ